MSTSFSARDQSINYISRYSAAAGHDETKGIMTPSISAYKLNQNYSNASSDIDSSRDRNYITNSLVAASPSQCHKRITSCDNITKQCGKAVCLENLGLTRHNTIDRSQRNNKLQKFQSFKSTPDLTSSNASSEMSALTKCNARKTDELSHPDVILLNNYQPLKNPHFQCHHHHQHNQNPISAATGHKCGTNQMPFFVLQRKTLASPRTASFLSETYCSCCRKMSNCDDDTCQTRAVIEKQKVLQSATSSKSPTNATSTTTTTITSTRF